MHFLFLFHRGNLRNLWIKEVSPDGILRIEVPRSLGRKLEVILMPAEEMVSLVDLTEDEAFTTAAYLSTIEDDPGEDAVWMEYLNENK